MDIEMMIELTKLWNDLANKKWRYVHGEEELNIKHFTELVKKTFKSIKEFRTNCDGKDFNIDRKLSNLTPKEMYIYIQLINSINCYATEETNITDESENYIATTSQVIANALIEYSCYYDTSLNPFYFIDDETLYINCTNSKLYFPEDTDEEKLYCIYKYNINTGDMSEVMELVKLADI